KTLTIVLVLVSFAFTCTAQIDEEKALYIQKAEKYRRMKNTGQILAIGGTVMMVTGIVMLSNVETTTNSYGQTTTTGNVGGGVALYLLGGCAVGAGVPLWIVGGINQGRYERKLQTVSVSLNVSPRSTGIGLRYRF
ncbi:MAG TPA: hypothetical protein VGD31_13295, partial [Sphingobacteriaceae bacterium]